MTILKMDMGYLSRRLNKSYVIAVCLLLVHVIPVVVSQQVPTTPNRKADSNYPYVTDLDLEGNYILRWRFNNTFIWFEVQAKTSGFVAFGISETGRMFPADVVVGYVSGDSVTFMDYHTTGYRSPTPDQSRDWELDYGYEENGWTVLGFYRPLDTCDVLGDRVITRGTQQLIYSYNGTDPQSPTSLSGHEHRGSKAVDLLTQSPAQYTEGMVYADFHNNYTIPLADKAHHCRLYTIAGTPIAQQKQHIVRISPYFPLRTRYNIIKMTLYRCSFPDMRLLRPDQDFDCFTDDVTITQYCKEYVISFVPGAEDFYLPADMGLPFGGSNRADLYVLATEYDNQNFEADLLDTSGVRMWYTSTLRTHDAAFLTVATPIKSDWYQLIPPHEEDFVQRAYCSQECLRWGFNTTNENQITLVGAQFEARRAGSAMRLRHLVPRTSQEGVKDERPWVLDNRKYYHTSQPVLTTGTRHRLSSDDTLLLECSYDTTSLTNYTLGGWLNSNELCRAHVLYYPPIQLEGCLSWSLYDTLRDANDAQIPSQMVFPTLKSVDWNNRSMRQVIKDIMGSSRHTAQCWSSRQNPKYKEHDFSQPRVPVPYTKPPNTSCATTTANRGGRT